MMSFGENRISYWLQLEERPCHLYLVQLAGLPEISGSCSS